MRSKGNVPPSVFQAVFQRKEGRGGGGHSKQTAVPDISWLILSSLVALLVHSRASVDIPPALLKGDCISSEIWSVLYTGGSPMWLLPPCGPVIFLL